MMSIERRAFELGQEHRANCDDIGFREWGNQEMGIVAAVAGIAYYEGRGEEPNAEQLNAFVEAFVAGYMGADMYELYADPEYDADDGQDDDADDGSDLASRH